MEREMIRLVLYEDGTVEEEPILSNRATQKAYTVKDGKRGIFYFCRKDKRDYYLKKLIKEEIRNNVKKITEIESRNETLGDLLEKISKEVIRWKE